MKFKKFSTIAFSILALTLILSSVSALSLSASPSSMIFTGTANTYQNLSISNSGSETFNITGFNITSKLSDSSGNSINIFSINPITSVNIPPTSQAIYNISLSNLGNGNFILGDNYLEQIQVNGINASGGGVMSTTNNVSLNYVKTFCQNGDLNDTSDFPLNIQISDAPSGIGSSSSTSWFPLDTITVQITLNNQNSNINLNNIVFDIGLYQLGTNNNVIGNMLWSGGSYNSYNYGSIGTNSNGQITFTFKVNPQVISNQGAGTYHLVVRAYGNQFCIDHSSNFNNNFGNGAISGGYSLDVNINQPGNNNAVIVDTSSLPSSTTASCGQSITLSPNIYNVGSNGNSYSQNQVLVTLTNPELGLNLNQTIYGGLSSGQSQSVPFTFTVPMNADQKTYPLYFRTFYGYNQNSNNGFFNNYQYESQNTFSTPLTIQGGCVYATPDTTQVTAQLVSGGKAGQPLVVQATVANTGNKTVTYTFGLEGYSSWASLSSISPTNVTLGAGQSQDVTLNLNVNQNTQGGNQVFYLDTYSNGYLITKQPMSIPITSGFSFGSLTGNAISGGNWFVWGFGLINLVLIVAIIIILVRLRRR